MQTLVLPAHLKGAIVVPPSKSITQRAYAVALLHNGKTTILNAGNSEDELAALNVIQKLGASLYSIDGNITEIHSEGVFPIAREIDCGESGLAARLFTPIAALSRVPVVITGKGSLMKRPMEGVQQAFTSLGVDFSDNQGHLPLTVHGPMHSMSFSLNASFGSQLLSGLLFALAFSTKDVVTIEVADLKSRPYIDLTLTMLATAGRPIQHFNYTSFLINPEFFHEPEILEINVEGDWSAAANLLVAGAISGEVNITNLNMDSAQADKAILDILEQANAEVAIGENGITATQSQLLPFIFDANDSPDLFPIISVLAAFCNGKSTVFGLSRLIHKESNRQSSICDMLTAFGIHHEIDGDRLMIDGNRNAVLKTCTVDGYNDHRIVMAAAVASLRTIDGAIISDFEAVKKSYPGFWSDFEKLGGLHKLVTD